MPTPRKYLSDAHRQAAWRVRHGQKRPALQHAIAALRVEIERRAQQIEASRLPGWQGFAVANIDHRELLIFIDDELARLSP
jgi:hypothetical protein